MYFDTLPLYTLAYTYTTGSTYWRNVVLI